MFRRSGVNAIGLFAILSAAIYVPTAFAQDADDAAESQRSAEQHYADFVHYIMIGRFDIAASEGRQLLDHPDATPANMLTFADQYKNSREAMLRVSGAERLGPIVGEIMKRINEGERDVRKDPKRVRANIEQLLGPPRAELYAIQRLQESGEYAIPWIVEALEDPKNADVVPRLVNVLPKIGKDGLNPLVQALNTSNDAARIQIIQSLGEIGYAQAMPYLKRIAEADDTPEDVRAAANDAVSRIAANTPGVSPGMSAAEMFVRLGEAYYENLPVVRVDPRLDEANVWYWKDGVLEAVAVPQLIWNEVMCLRSCESALELNANAPGAVSLWLAANFRREAELEMDPTAEGDDPREALDKTRPSNFPRAIYFARSAGPQYNLEVLARAIRSGNAAVALGAIAALAETGGPKNMAPNPGSQSPLAAALTFPDLLVRLKAALVLGDALPREQFVGSERVVPTLAEALAQTGQASMIVVDPDETNRNRVQGALREDGINAVAEADLFSAMNRAKAELPTVDAVVLATDVQSPGLAEALAQLRGDYSFANLPIILLVKPDTMVTARALAAGDARITTVLADAPKTTLLRAWQTVAARVGKTPLSSDEALELALQSAEVLREIAVAGSAIYSFDQAVNALINALAYPVEDLRIRAAAVLALTNKPEAQVALAEVATSDQQSETLRLAAFDALAESASHHGNLLPADLVERLLDQAMNAGDMVIRVNASKALGALNLPSATPARIINTYHAN